MRTLLFATVALLSLPAFASSLESFVEKPDEEVAALHLTKAKFNSLLKNSPKAISIDRGVIFPFHSNYDPSPAPGSHELADDEELDPRMAKCVLLQVAELKKLNSDKTLSSLKDVSYHIVLMRRYGVSTPPFSNVVAAKDGVVLQIALGAYDLDQCSYPRADEISREMHAAYRIRVPSRAEELAPANESDLVDDLKNTSFHPGGGREAPPKIESIDL